ncbi:unnamed protein product [Polarella glacialis]|uniref:Uncharacterized protein n=1 Tax=Polarella glacialis TaxID=89957 RepID=A0A813FZT8_POLGL|nr:unnamed protein product [Polarella glacialis]
MAAASALEASEALAAFRVPKDELRDRETKELLKAARKAVRDVVPWRCCGTANGLDSRQALVRAFQAATEPTHCDENTVSQLTNGYRRIMEKLAGPAAPRQRGAAPAEIPADVVRAEDAAPAVTPVETVSAQSAQEDAVLVKLLATPGPPPGLEPHDSMPVGDILVSMCMSEEHDLNPSLGCWASPTTAGFSVDSMASFGDDWGMTVKDEDPELGSWEVLNAPGSLSERMVPVYLKELNQVGSAGECAECATWLGCAYNHTLENRNADLVIKSQCGLACSGSTAACERFTIFEACPDVPGSRCWP